MEISITTFKNPHLFWFFEVKNLKNRELLENELRDQKPVAVAKVQIGQVVAIYDDCYKRAIVKSTNSPYTCWLLDYGIQRDVRNVYKISTESASKLPLVKQGALINTVFLEQVHSGLEIIDIKKVDFTIGCIKRSQDYIETAEKLFFSCVKEVNNVHLGTITITSAGNTFDLTETLIDEKVFIEDKDLFESAFAMNSKVDLHLKSVTCSPQLKKFGYSEDDFIESGIGRGIIRGVKRDNVAYKATLEEWVQQSKLSTNKDVDEFDSDEDYRGVEHEDGVNLNSQTSVTVSLKDLKQAYANDDTSRGSEDLDVLNSIMRMNKTDHSNGSKKSKSINWNELRSENTNSATHINIPPSGMLLPKARKTQKRNEIKKKPSISQSSESTDIVVNQEKSVTSASDHVKNSEDTPLHLTKKSMVGCACEQCVGWEGEDLYFNENKKRFQDTKCVKKTKEVVKPLLLLKEGDVPPVKIKSCVTDSKTKIKRSSAPTVLVHGTMFLSPVTSLSAIPFHADIHKALRPYEHVYSLQSYAWPALMRHMSVCIIGNRHTGKTMSYLPAICTFELERKERYPDLPQNTISPLTVILCPGVQVAEKVFNTILKLLEHASGKTYVALAVPPVDKNCLNQFQKQVHILVATPKTLTSLVATRIITLKRLCHFIIEKADIVLEKFSKEVGSLLHLIQSMLSHRGCIYSVQMVLTTEQWTLPIEAVLKSLLIVPIVCISSYLEAALYGRVDLQLNFTESKMKMATLANFLKGKAEVCRTVVICNTNEEIGEVKEFLLIAGVSCLYITDDMEYKDILEIESRWLHSSAGKHFALICVERVFSHSINITNAILLVHYSLPHTWTQFVDRFRCMIDNYNSPLTDDVSNEWTRCKVQIFVDESCTKQFPKIVQVMERLGAKLPAKFQKYYQETIQNDENEKISARIKVCNDLRLFGKCSSAYCTGRHFLSKDIDFVSNLPKSGILKFKVMLVRNVTSFTIKVLEHTDTDGKITKYDLNEDLETRIKEAMNEERNSIFDAKPGNRYVYHSASDKKYYRCTVRKILTTEKITKKASTVAIRCMDTGVELDTPCSSLYELPASFKKINPQVIDVFLANLVPPDLDDSWSFYAKTRVEKILQDADYDIKDTYATGQIQLQLGNVLWLKNIMLYQLLQSTNLTVNKLNLRKRLLDDNLAIVNEAQLEGLYKSCADANIELPDYNMATKESEVPLIKQVKPQWSYLDESESIEIYIAYVETPSLFYVRLKKFYDLFLNLQKEIQEIIQKPFYPSVGEVCLDGCYLAKDPEGDDYARVIVKEIVGDFIKVFFVDYGDYATLHKTELKYLPDELISKLPFQVIECRLYGVEPIDNQWDLTAIHKFFDFVFEPNTDYFRTLYTTSCKQEPSNVTGGLKYSVLLVDNFQNNLVIINKMLIDCKEAIPIKDEDINLEFSLPVQVAEEEIDAISDIEDKEMTVEEIRKLQEKHGSKIQEIEATGTDDDEPVWDLVINNAESFLKNFVSHDTGTPSTSARTDWDLPALQALPPSTYSTPNILWHQTEAEIKINIMLPNVTNCDLKVVREKFVLFSTLYNDKQYKLNIHLFDNVDKKFQYTLGGPHIKVTLKKKATAEWPRLIVSTQKMRYIKYDYMRCDVEEEKAQRFLDLGLGSDDEDVGDDVVPEIGSDENYSESDFESDVED